MVQDILENRGITFETDVPGILIGGGKGLLVRLGSMTRGLVLKPLKKMFRTVFFWFTARSAARTAMVTYFLARFLHQPDLVSPGTGNRLTKQRAEELAEIFREVSEDIDLRAVRGTFRRVAGLFARNKDISGGEVGEEIERSAPGFIAEFDTMVRTRLAG